VNGYQGGDFLIAMVRLRNGDEAVTTPFGERAASQCARSKSSVQIRLACPADSFISVFSEMSDATVLKQPSEPHHPRAVAVACGPLVVLPLLTLPLIHHVPPWAFMWLMAIALFTGFKWLTFATSHAPAATVPIQLLYLAAWPGLAPDEFIRPLPESRRPTHADWFPPARNLLVGLLLVTLVAPRIATPLVRGWTGMVGTILVLHFGAFHLLALAYRSFGLDARPLMLQPLRSGTLAEFWGRRWNTAFAALAGRHAFRPLARRIGARHAIALVFVGSGLIHEAVITVPAGGGYGLPTLFFGLQALGMGLERHPAISGRPKIRRALAWLFLIGPLGCLFPPVFVERVILPMLDSIHSFLPTP
jgi:Membrane bound O-acyl transferase family